MFRLEMTTTLLMTGNSIMRKTLVSALAVAFTATMVNAQATFFLDARDNIANIDTPQASPTGGFAANPLGGVRGDGQTIYVAPNVPGAPAIPGGNMSTMTLYVDYAAGAGEVLAAVGLDYAIDASAANERALSAAALTIHNSAAEVDQTGANGLAGAPWNDTAGSGDTLGGSIKAVRVPVSGATPAFDASLGIQAGNGYRLATVDLTAEDCNGAGGCEPALNVFMSVNNLLVTQVSAGGSGAVALNFGFDGAGAADASPDTGDVEGATSAIADATIVLRSRGDFNGDGAFNGLDLGLVLPTVGQSGGGLANQAAVHAGDFNGDGSFNGLDLGLILPTIGASAGCTVCVP